MIRRLFWIAVGAVGALQLDRWMQTSGQKLRPTAMTGRLLDGINRRLEARSSDAR